MTKREKKRLKRLAKLCVQLQQHSTEAHLCRLSDEQLHYICHRLSVSCYVEACPGSGKTEIVGMKAAYELADWQERSAGIAILAFTRNAARVIRNRVTEYAGNSAGYPHFIGTIDSWLHGYLLQPFGHAITGYAGKNGDKSVSIIENDLRADFLNNYKVTAAQAKGISANQYYKKYNGQLEGAPRTSIQHFDQRLLAETKDRFLRDGFATYQDAEHICYQVLKQQPVIAKRLSRRFPYVIIDECQDLSYSQLCVFYKLLAAGTALHIIGDPQQAIYKFRKVDPSKLESFVKRLAIRRQALTRNYRSNQAIVDTCRRLVKTPQVVRGVRPTILTAPCRLWQYTSENLGSLPQHFSGLISELKLSKRKSCILVRGTSLLSQLHPSEGNPRSSTALLAKALIAWNESQRSTLAIESALHNVGKSLSLLAYAGRGRHQQQYCPDHLKPHDWRQFLANILNDASYLYPFNQGLTWTDLAAQLKHYLRGTWDSLPTSKTEWATASRKIRAPKGKGKLEVSGEIHPVTSTHGLRITTIHGVKGETFDAVLLISATTKKSPGGHIDHWLHPDKDNEEYQRFAYVACSRPRHLLVLATPQLTSQQLKKVHELGLEPEEVVASA
ncbi:MAG: ATP-dependent helicase [bacterium]|nr:ATP-dependent helicase [bacterium]